MRFLPAILVFGAAGAGYIHSQEGLIRSLSPANWISDEGAVAVGDSAAVERLATAPREEIVVVPGPEISNFGDVFRFDLSPQAITQKWSRVSTGLGDLRFQGYRVPLVTGTDESDLAGSLTYYFDGQPKARRITFLGSTGNPQRLIEFMTKNFGFRRIQNGNARTTTYRTRFRFSGMLEISPAEVLNKNLASTNYRVELWLDR